jgi:hypothetical protein
VDGRQSSGVAAACLPTLRDSAAAHTAPRPAMPIAPDRERHERATGRHRRSTRPAERAAIALRQVHDRRRTASHPGRRRGLSRSAGMVRRVELRTPVPDDGMNRRLGAHRDRRAGSALAGQTWGCPVLADRVMFPRQNGSGPATPLRRVRRLWGLQRQRLRGLNHPAITAVSSGASTPAFWSAARYPSD